jgi:hypothetical protein
MEGARAVSFWMSANDFWYNNSIPGMDSHLTILPLLSFDHLQTPICRQLIPVSHS